MILVTVTILILSGIVLHMTTAFIKSSGPVSAFSIGLLIWSLFPYLAISLAYKKGRYGALCAAIVVLSFDIEMYMEVFVRPKSSTATLGLLFMPLWNLVIIIPVSFLVGYFIEKGIRKIKKGSS